MNTTKLSAQLRHRLRALAVNDAKFFVAEFDEPLAPATTDWDAVAWQDNWRLLGDDLKHEDHEEAWEYYQKHLVQMTAKFCRP
jgi:hypothetical protein